MQRFIYAFVGLIAGIALTFIYQHRLSGTAEYTGTPNEALVTPGESDVSTGSNPFSPATESFPDGVTNSKSVDETASSGSVSDNANDNKAAKDRSNPGTSEIDSYQELSVQLQWLESATIEEIELTVERILSENLSTPESYQHYSAGSNQVYKHTFVYALLSRWLEADANSAITFILQPVNYSNQNQASLLIKGMAYELIGSLSDTQPELLASTLDELDPEQIAEDPFLLDLQMQIDPEGTLARAENSDDPDLVISVLYSYAHELAMKNPQEAIEWVNSRSAMPPGVRENLLPSLYYQWAESDPVELLQFIESGNTVDISSEVLVGAYIALGRENPEDALARINELPARYAETARMSVVSDWSYQNPQAASAWLQQALAINSIDAAEIPPFMLADMPVEVSQDILDHLPTAQREQAIFAMGQRLQDQGPGAYQQFIDALPDPASREVAALSQLPKLAESDPRLALDQLAAITPQMQDMLFVDVVMRSEYTEPGVVAEWMANNDLPDDLARQIENLLSQTNMNDFGGIPPYVDYYQMQRMIESPASISREGSR